VSTSSSEFELGLVHEVVWRRASLLALLRLAAVIGTAWLAAVFATTPGLIGTGYGITDIIIVAAVWAAALLPLAEGMRFAVLEGAFFGVSANVILLYGSTPGVPVLLGLAILTAAIYHDRKGGVIAGMASLLLIAGAAWSWTAHILPAGPSLPKLVPTEYDFWMRTMFAQVMAVGGITAIVAYLTGHKRNILSRLHLAEEKFTKSFRVCPDAMVITELETGRFIEVNDSHERLIGYKRDEVVGRTSVEIGTFSSGDERQKAFADELRSTGSLRHVSWRIKDRAGREIDVLYSSECFDLAGVRCALTIIRDVTEQKRTEAALMANEHRFRSFIENANVGIYRSTPDGRIVMVNPALLRITGYDTFEQMETRNLETEEYEPGYTRKNFKERIEREGQLYGWETTWRKRDGTSINVRESATVIRGADGSVLYYDGTVEDISQRRKAEEALRESEERFRNLTAAAFEGIVITENGRILDINDQGLRLFGCTLEEMIGREVMEFVPPEGRQVVSDHIRNGFEGTYEHLLLRKDGSVFQAEAQAKMSRLGDRFLRMTALRDITERRQNEQRQKNLEEQLRQMQKMEALGTLAGGIAHDFNNILTGILGYLQLAEMDLPKGHPAFVSLGSAEKASMRARDLVARILAFSRLEQDNRAMAPIGPVVLEAVQLLRVGIPTSIEIRTQIDATCPSVVFDPGQVHQVIMNLGTNSIHAMGAHGGVLSVTLQHGAPTAELRERHPQVSAAHTVRLTLRDNGCGMDQAILKRIFEPFYTTRTFGKGTGLGLAMVHAIMNSHKGAIVVESAPGAGTTFDLYFPAAPVQAPAPVPPAPSKASFVPFGKNREIMLVDDEDAVRTIAESLLRRFGFKPSAFALPVAALEAFRAEPASFCAVITDLTMPEMTGLELAGHMLAARPDTPIILTSGYLQADVQQNARASGVRRVIKKPFDVHELMAQVRAVLDDPPA
jgi:two-component system cell cycle sensor histidine kinase/response regulator CckA